MLSSLSVRPGRRWPRCAAARRSCAGLSLPELLVGLTLGLLVTAAALALVALASGEQRRLLAEARLQQDLRAAMDIVARELRRSGQWPDATAGVWGTAVPASGVPSVAMPAASSSTVPATGSPAPSATAPVAGSPLATPLAGPAANPYGAFLAVPCNAAAANAASSAMPPAVASHACHLTATDDDAAPTRSGFHVSRGVLHAVLQGGTPQALTDPGATRVRRFTVASAGRDVALGAFCGPPCGDRCPSAALRAVVVELQAALPDDPRVERVLKGTVRVRNDLLTGRCPAP